MCKSNTRRGDLQVDSGVVVPVGGGLGVVQAHDARGGTEENGNVGDAGVHKQVGAAAGGQVEGQAGHGDAATVAV